MGGFGRDVCEALGGLGAVCSQLNGADPFGVGGAARQLEANRGGDEHLFCPWRAGVEEFLAEPIGGVVDDRGGLETGGGAVAAGGAEAFGH